MKNVEIIDQAIADLTSWLLDRCSDNPEDGQGFEDVDAEIDGVRELLQDLRDRQVALEKSANSLLVDIEALQTSEDDGSFGPFEEYDLDQLGFDGVTISWHNLSISAAKVQKLLDDKG